MALVIKDRVKETTTTSGTGTYNLGGASTGFESFASVGDGNTTYYCCTDGTNFEIGIGTYTASGTTLARTTILQSSNSDNAVSWADTSVKNIFCTMPSDKSVFLDANGTLTLTGGDSGDILLVFNTDRTWQFQQNGDDGSTSLGLKANTDSKSFVIQNSNGDTDFNFFTSHSGTPNFTLGKDAVLIFEGSSNDANETTLTVTDPTADRTITLPNATGTVITTGNTSDVTSVGTLTGLAVNGTVTANDITLNTGANSLIKLQDSTGTQVYQIKANVSDSADYGLLFEDGDNNDIAKFLDNGECLLTHNHNTKFQTTSTGVSITGGITTSSVGRDANDYIDFTGNEIVFRQGGQDQIKLTDGALVPVTDNDIDLGTSNSLGNGLEFKNLYLDGTAYVDGISCVGNITNTGDIKNTGYYWQMSDAQYIYFGVNFEVSLRHVHNTGLLLNGAMQLQFGDDGTYIHQSADGVLDLVADGELELNGALVDINSTNGNVDIGTTGGNVTLTGDVGAMTFTNNGSANIVLDPSTNGYGVEIKGNNGGGTLQLNCENNSHGVKIQSPDHSASQSYTLKLPDNQIATDKILKVKSITGSGATAVGQLEFADESGGGGGGASNLNGLSDVTIASVANNDLLKYNSTAGEWQNTNLGLTVTPTLSSIGHQAGASQSVVTVTNHSSYDLPAYSVEVRRQDNNNLIFDMDSISGSTESIDIDTDDEGRTTGTITINTSHSASNFDDLTTDNFKVLVIAQDFGDIQSEVATLNVSLVGSTQTSFDSSTAFRYWRITDFGGSFWMRNWKAYSAINQGGTAYPTTEAVASNGTPSDKFITTWTSDGQTNVIKSNLAWSTSYTGADVFHTGSAGLWTLSLGSSYWSTDNGFSTPPSYAYENIQLVWDMGTARTIKSMQLIYRDAYTATVSSGDNSFIIQGSNDESNWTTVSTVTASIEDFSASSGDTTVQVSDQS